MSRYLLTLVFISLFAHSFRFESPLFQAPHEIFGDCQLYSNFVGTSVVFVRCLSPPTSPRPLSVPCLGQCVLCVVVVRVLRQHTVQRRKNASASASGCD